MSIRKGEGTPPGTQKSGTHTGYSWALMTQEGETLALGDLQPSGRPTIIPMPLNTGTVVHSHRENLQWTDHHVVSLVSLTSSLQRITTGHKEDPMRKHFMNLPVLATALASSNAVSFPGPGISIIHHIWVHLTCSHGSPSPSVDPESAEMLKGLVESRSAGCRESHLVVLSPSVPLYALSIHPGADAPSLYLWLS